MVIKQATFLTSAVRKEQWMMDDIPEFCFIGRSNVGKSSFLNTLANHKNLARISQRPGKTQVLNFFVINKDQCRFVDVPGYGFAKVSDNQKQQFAEMMEEYLTQRTNLKAVFLLLDFRHAPSKDDILMLEYLQSKHIKICLVATKIDKVSKNQYVKHKKNILNTLKLSLTTPIILFSSFNKTGIDDVLVTFDNILKVN